jgi:hypothetical protein
VFSNHSMVASLRGSDTMRCAAVASCLEIYFFPICWMFVWMLEHSK